MVDQFKNGRPQHRSCVTMDDKQECRYWTEKLGCSEDELAAAIARVGNSPDAVRRDLFRHWGYGTFQVGKTEAPLQRRRTRGRLFKQA
jgi:Protein of unknown function (DUF3606)